MCSPSRGSKPQQLAAKQVVGPQRPFWLESKAWNRVLICSSRASKALKASKNLRKSLVLAGRHQVLLLEDLKKTVTSSS